MDELEPVAGNGLLGRRALFKAGLVGGAALLTAQANAASKQREPWMNTPGAPMDEIGEPSIHTAHIKRVRVGSVRGTTGTGSSRTPLELLDGIITPSRLHFERHHNGILLIVLGVLIALSF